MYYIPISSHWRVICTKNVGEPLEMICAPKVPPQWRRPGAASGDRRLKFNRLCILYIKMLGFFYLFVCLFFRID